MYTFYYQFVINLPHPDQPHAKKSIIRQEHSNTSSNMMKSDFQQDKYDETSLQQPIINEMLLYGVMDFEHLTMEDILNNKLVVGVLKHYQRGKIIIGDNQDEFYEMWAYPDGIKIYNNRLDIINDKQPEHSFGPRQNISLYTKQYLQGGVKEKPDDFIYSFVHTDYSLNRTYFTALCWHEKKYCPIDKEKLSIVQNNRNIYTQRLPKCTLWELQNDPLMIDFNQQLVYIPKVLIISSKYPLFLFQKELLKFYYRNMLVQTNDLYVNTEHLNHFKELIHLVGYPEAQAYYESEQMDKSCRQPSYKQIKKKQLSEFYTSFLFLPKLSKNTNHLQITDCWNSSIKFTPVQYNRNLCFSKPNLNILGVIKKIGIKKLLTLWKCMILQRKILIFSMDNLDLIELCETLLYLIEPIRWENIYIPFLPLFLVNNIDAIQSFVIGMSKIHMNYVIEHFSMNDKVLVDLDENIIIENGGKNQVDLPPKIYGMLYDRLTALGFKKDNILSVFFKDSGNQQHQTEDERIFKIKQIFFDGMLYLLNNYRPFARLNESNLLEFDREGYKNMFTDQNWKDFAAQLVQTMVFVRLCEYHLYEQKILKWNQYNIGGLFVYCQNILIQKYKKDQQWEVPRMQKTNLEKLDIPYHEYFNYVLKNDREKMKNQLKIYDLERYVIKYLNYIELNKENMNLPAPEKPQRNKIIHILIDFLFPWVKQFTQQLKNEQLRTNCRNSLRLSLQDLPNLQCLFGGMKSDQNGLNKGKIQRMLKESKTKKNSFIDYRLINRNINAKERVSV